MISMIEMMVAAMWVAEMAVVKVIMDDGGFRNRFSSELSKKFGYSSISRSLMEAVGL